MSNWNGVIEIAQELMGGRLACERVVAEFSKIESVPPSCEDLFHFLYHYSADEDIRRRDHEYASFQNRRLEELMRQVMGHYS